MYRDRRALPNIEKVFSNTSLPTVYNLSLHDNHYEICTFTFLNNNFPELSANGVNIFAKTKKDLNNEKMYPRSVNIVNTCRWSAKAWLELASFWKNRAVEGAVRMIFQMSPYHKYMNNFKGTCTSQHITNSDNNKYAIRAFTVYNCIAVSSIYIFPNLFIPCPKSVQIQLFYANFKLHQYKTHRSELHFNCKFDTI